MFLGRFEDLLKDTQSEVSTVHSQVSTVHFQVSAIHPQVSDTCSEVFNTCTEMSTDVEMNKLEPAAELLRTNVNSICYLNLTPSTDPTSEDGITPAANVFTKKDRLDPLKLIPKLTRKTCE